ncbi:hypothetical protein AAFF_G00131280 [Aldrovandia affinis]|uniref:Uncharacterized protein n=1 Tax=Aldrovandia affinis TaxID=143900 RepID=A0AAD7RQW0_9TELE|nr:hypothetical protein AAFF_G00131280 [Aldrovandia affinis]
MRAAERAGSRQPRLERRGQNGGILTRRRDQDRAAVTGPSEGADPPRDPSAAPTDKCTDGTPAPRSVKVTGPSGSAGPCGTPRRHLPRKASARLREGPRTVKGLRRREANKTRALQRC